MQGMRLQGHGTDSNRAYSPAMINTPISSAQINFFSSHSWTYSHRREGLHGILRPWIRGQDFQDYSVSRAHPLGTDTDPELARVLRNIIARMDALLIMAGMYANNSAWMQFEINMAFAFNVPIIPILDNGQERVPRLPTRLATVDPIRWRGNSIRETLLRCITPERRQAIEARVAFRTAAEAERQQRAVEAAHRSQADTWPMFSQTSQAPPIFPLRRNALADLLDPQPTRPLFNFPRR